MLAGMNHPMLVAAVWQFRVPAVRLEVAPRRIAARPRRAAHVDVPAGAARPDYRRRRVMEVDLVRVVDVEHGDAGRLAGDDAIAELAAGRLLPVVQLTDAVSRAPA